MRANLEAGMTVEEFLAWLETKPRKPRYELIAGEPVEMSPGRVRHAKVKANIRLALHQAIGRSGIAYTALADGIAVRSHRVRARRLRRGE